MAEIHALKTRLNLRNEEVVGILRHYLTKAEKGELVAIAFAALMPDGSCLTQTSGSEHFPTLVGAIAILQHRLLLTSLTVKTDG